MEANASIWIGNGNVNEFGIIETPVLSETQFRKGFIIDQLYNIQFNIGILHAISTVSQIELKSYTFFIVTICFW